MDHYFGSPSFPFLHLLRAAGERPRWRQSSCCWALWMQHLHLIMLRSVPSSSRDNSECSPFSSIPSNSSRKMTLPSHRKSNNNIIRCSRNNFLNINLVARLPTLPSFCPSQYFQGLWLLQDSAQSITVLPLYQLPFSSGSLLSAQIKRFRAIYKCSLGPSLLLSIATLFERVVKVINVMRAERMTTLLSNSSARIVPGRPSINNPHCLILMLQKERKPNWKMDKTHQ